MEKKLFPFDFTTLSFFFIFVSFLQRCHAFGDVRVPRIPRQTPRRSSRHATLLRPFSHEMCDAQSYGGRIGAQPFALTASLPQRSVAYGLLNAGSVVSKELGATAEMYGRRTCPHTARALYSSYTVFMRVMISRFCAGARNNKKLGAISLWRWMTNETVRYPPVEAHALTAYGNSTTSTTSL